MEVDDEQAIPVKDSDILNSQVSCVLCYLLYAALAFSANILLWLDPFVRLSVSCPL